MADECLPEGEGDLGAMDPLMVGIASPSPYPTLTVRFFCGGLIPLLRLPEYIQCLPALRSHPLRSRYSRLDCICTREQEAGDIDV